MSLSTTKIKSVSFIFIIGRSRSGTTLLRSMLDMHPGISIPNECTFILQLSKRYKNVKNWNPGIIENFLRDLKKTWLFDNLKLDINNLKISLLNLGLNTNYQEICKQVILHTPSALIKTNLLYVGDKNPSYSLHFKDLFNIFSDACKYIYINRDYRDQYVSLKNAGIELPNIVVSAKRWNFAFRSFFRTMENKGLNYFYLRYEDLVNDPEKKLTEICSFLNIPYDAGMLEFYTIENLKKSFSEASLQEIHSSIKNPVTKDKIGLWENYLSKRQVQLLDKICSKTEKQSGYESVSTINYFVFLIGSFPGYLLYYFTLLSSCFLKLMPFSVYLKFSGGAFLGSIRNRIFRKK